jgi:mono/diheme cytochrome c family protein
LLCLGTAPSVAQIVDGQRAVSWMGKNPLEQENAKRGAAIFQQSCAYCHGKNADGGSEAPNLIRSLLVRHDKSGDLIGPVIQDGSPDRGMPAIRLPADQAADVVTYLHALLSLSDSAGDSMHPAVQCRRLKKSRSQTGLSCRPIWMAPPTGWLPVSIRKPGFFM